METIQPKVDEPVSEELMLVKTLLTAVATLLTPVTQTRAIKATSNAYSTRS